MIELVFFTSSRIKLEHAKYLCRNYAVRLTGFREKTFGANYDEPRIYDRTQLIELSYQDALRRWNKATSGKGFFILEDTSVVIDALSIEREIPGLDIKYWMQDIDFETLDAELKVLGNNRRVTVRSDLVLHLPEDLRRVEDKGFLLFTSSALGTIAEKEQIFETNAVYPWLDNKTFNKWFVPDGSKKPISMLPIVEADQHDFRAPAFKAMLEYLERHQKIHANIESSIQTSFDFDAKLFVICGPTCAGKTTLAEYLAAQYGYWHIEASDYMRLNYYQRHGVSENLDIGGFAAQALKEKPEIVAEQILKSIKQLETIPVIITGFRSPAELEWFRNNYSGNFSVEVVFVDAESEIRYSRSVDRQRESDSESKEEFLRRDRQQAAMGLAEFRLAYPNNIIKNNTTLESYFDNFEQKYRNSFVKVEIDSKTSKTLSSGELEKQILFTLAEHKESKRFFTTTEIAGLINQNVKNAKPKSKNNVSRYFNQTFHPYYEIKVIDGKRKYRLSNSGFSRVGLLKSLLSLGN
jgi:dephospho-CoA kinase/inosine/xanthosine triphosphate pyrophosphatase family protein